MRKKYTKNRLVYGVGINDLDERVTVDSRIIDSYNCWKAMLERCYSEKCHSKKPTYIGCTVCEEWLSFSNFKQWHDLHYIEGFHLDKDILFEGNKIYSPKTCRFVPSNINLLLLDSRASRGDLPVGVTALTPDTQKGRVNTTYIARCSNGYGKHLNKTFKTLEEAVQWYSETKTRIVREVAQRALDDGEIQQDIFNALVSRQF